MYRILEAHKCIHIICQNIKSFKNKNYFIMSETTFHFTMMLGFLHKYFELSCLHLTLTRLWRLKRFVGGSSSFNWFKNDLSQNVSCIISRKNYLFPCTAPNPKFYFPYTCQRWSFLFHFPPEMCVVDISSFCGGLYCLEPIEKVRSLSLFLNPAELW